MLGFSWRTGTHTRAWVALPLFIWFLLLPVFLAWEIIFVIGWCFFKVGSILLTHHDDKILARREAAGLPLDGSRS